MRLQEQDTETLIKVTLGDDVVIYVRASDNCIDEEFAPLGMYEAAAKQQPHSIFHHILQFLLRQKQSNAQKLKDNDEVELGVWGKLERGKVLVVSYWFKKKLPGFSHQQYGVAPITGLYTVTRSQVRDNHTRT